MEQTVGGWRSGPSGLEVGGKIQTTEDGRQTTEENCEFTDFLLDSDYWLLMICDLNGLNDFDVRIEAQV